MPEARGAAALADADWDLLLLADLAPDLPLEGAVVAIFLLAPRLLGSELARLLEEDCEETPPAAFPLADPLLL